MHETKKNSPATLGLTINMQYKHINNSYAVLFLLY